VRESSLSLTVKELSITEAKVHRPAKASSAPMPAVEELTDAVANESQPQIIKSVSMPMNSSAAVDYAFSKYISNSKS